MEELDWSKDGKQFRYEKTIKPRDDKFTDNPSVIKVSNDATLEDYYEEVYDFITNLEKKGVVTDRNQIAFLFKSVKNDKVIGLAEYLEDRGVQIFSPRSSLFFQRDEIQLLLGAIVFVFPDLFEILKWSDTAKLEVWDYYQSCKYKFAQALRYNQNEHQPLLQWCQTRAKEHLTLVENTNYGSTYHIAFFQRGKDGKPVFDESFEAILGDPAQYIKNLAGSEIYGCVVKKTTKSDKWFDNYLKRTNEQIEMLKTISLLKSILNMR